MNWQKLDNSTLEYSYEISSYFNTRPLWRVYIKGSQGTVHVDNIVCVIHSADNIEMLYKEIINVLDGNYHCCLTGKSYWF